MSRTHTTVLALIVSAVSVVALAITLVVVPVVYDLVYDEYTVIEVAPKQSAELAGLRFELVASAAFPGEGLDVNQVPIGDGLIAAVIEIEDTTGKAEDEPISCDAQLVEPATGRTWDTVVSERDFGYGITDESTTQCYVDEDSIRYEPVFLTPDGVYDDVVIEITVSSDLRNALHFELVPST